MTQFLRDTRKLEQPLVQVRLIVVGDDVLMVQNDGDLMSVLQYPGQHVLRVVVDLGRVVQSLREDVAKSRVA